MRKKTKKLINDEDKKRFYISLPVLIGGLIFAILVSLGVKHFVVGVVLVGGMLGSGILFLIELIKEKRDKDSFGMFGIVFTSIWVLVALFALVVAILSYFDIL